MITFFPLTSTWPWITICRAWLILVAHKLRKITVSNRRSTPVYNPPHNSRLPFAAPPATTLNRELYNCFLNTLSGNPWPWYFRVMRFAYCRWAKSLRSLTFESASLMLLKEGILDALCRLYLFHDIRKFFIRLGNTRNTFLDRAYGDFIRGMLDDAALLQPSTSRRKRKSTMETESF
jgi:hypothetical protein